MIARLKDCLPVKLPQYDKSKLDGLGDRVDDALWEQANSEGSEPIGLVLLEGWCVGFRPLGHAETTWRWQAAKGSVDEEPSQYEGRLGSNRLEDVLFIDEALGNYNHLTKSSPLQIALWPFFLPTCC